MRVLSVYKTYFPDPPGGLQEAIRQICIATTRLGVENTIFTLTPTLSQRQIQLPEANIIREKSWLAPASCDISGLSSFKTYSLLCAQVDLIHFFYPWPFADLLNFCVDSKKPKVLTYISDIVQQKFLKMAYAPLMWRTLKRVDIIVANSQAYAASSPILSHPEIRNKVRIIPLAIDRNSYPTTSALNTLQKYSLDPTQPYFLFIGVHRYYKGLHTLIEASLRCKVKIIIAGTGPKTSELTSLAKRLKAFNVEFIGAVSDEEKVSLITGCRALVLPSHLRSEAFGMVLVEAAMLGKPMISCEIGTGTSFINLHGITGLVTKPESVEELSDAINMLSNDIDLANRMGINAQKRYEEHFSSYALGRSYASLFRSLI